MPTETTNVAETIYDRSLLAIVAIDHCNSLNEATELCFDDLMRALQSMRDIERRGQLTSEIVAYTRKEMERMANLAESLLHLQRGQIVIARDILDTIAIAEHPAR